MNTNLKKAINTAYGLYGKKIPLADAPLTRDGSPHGFLRLHVAKPDFRGDRVYTIFYGKQSELFSCEDEQEALTMWRRLCKLEAMIIKTIGGEILNQW